MLIVVVLCRGLSSAREALQDLALAGAAAAVFWPKWLRLHYFPTVLVFQFPPSGLIVVW